MGTVDEASVRVVLVDDDALVRSGLALMLGGNDRIAVVGEAPDGKAALQVVAETHPDVVLMDIRMPIMDGLQATERMLAGPRPPKILVLTTFDADEHVLRALRLGASGFLLKDTPPREIVRAVLAIADGQPVLSPSVTAQLIATVSSTPSSDPRRDEARARIASLTEREGEVARAVARGLDNAQIAAELYLSVPTVKAHIGRLFTKTGAENRVQLALLVHDAEEN